MDTRRQSSRRRCRRFRIRRRQRKSAPHHRLFAARNTCENARASQATYRAREDSRSPRTSQARNRQIRRARSARPAGSSSLQFPRLQSYHLRTIGTRRAGCKVHCVSTRIPGPGRWETLRRLAPNPFPRFTPFLIDITKRYGNVVAFAMPWRSYVFINEPALIKDLFVTQQHAFSKSLGARTLKYLLGEGLLTSEDPLHRQMRRIVQPAFHHERIAEYGRAFETHAKAFVDGVVPGQPFDVHAAMTELTLRIATTTLFGSDESGSTQAVS